MIYRPVQKRLWDTWLCLHEGTYYLYYLVAGAGSWEGVGLATSSDGVHFGEVGVVIEKAPDVNWLGTGSVWKAKDFASTGRFLCNFSEWRNGRPEESSPSDGRQTIFFAESTDLINWTRIEGVEFVQDERWYEREGRWDCIYTIRRPGGGRYGYWTATPKDGPGVGFGETLDGVNWTALPPPKIEWGHAGPAPGCEAGAVEEIDGRFYLMLGSYGGYDNRVNGMWTFVADAPEGPFVATKHNHALLTSRVRANSYFARFFPTEKGMLVNHHSIPREGGGDVAMAPLKRAVVDAKGTLRLGWWEGNEALKGEEVDPWAEFDMGEGIVVEGTLIEAPGLGGQASGTLGIDNREEGTGIMFQIRGGGVDIQPIDTHRRGLPACDDSIELGEGLGNEVRFKLLVRWNMAELYVNDLLVQCYSLAPMKTGRIAVEGGTWTDVTGVKAWGMSRG